MKRKLFIFCLIGALILSALSGCSLLAAARGIERLDNAVDFAEDSLENAIESTIIPADKVPVTSAPSAETAPKKEITAQEAEAIALAHAGLTADQVQALRSEYDRDDGRTEYDVHFRQDRWEYEYEINAQTGEIQSWDRDWDD